MTRSTRTITFRTISSILLLLATSAPVLAEFEPMPAPLLWGEDLESAVKVDACIVFNDRFELNAFIDTVGSLVPRLDISVETLEEGAYRVCV